jgi:hypothetical protein
MILRLLFMYIYISGKFARKVVLGSELGHFLFFYMSEMNISAVVQSQRRKWSSKILFLPFLS